jgi:hypothetical protein
MKYLYLFLCLMFVLFAAWQYNDPDPILWITIYGVAAYCSFRAFRGDSNRELLFILTIISLAAGVNSWLQMTAWEGVITDSIAMKTHNQELAREALGLGICAFSFLLALIGTKKN